jgi:hypothetical protein
VISISHEDVKRFVSAAVVATAQTRGEYDERILNCIRLYRNIARNGWRHGMQQQQQSVNVRGWRRRLRSVQLRKFEFERRDDFGRHVERLFFRRW